MINRSLRFILAGVFLFQVPLKGFADDWDSQQEAKEHQLQDLAFPEIERALKVLRGGPRLAQKCDEPTQHNCTFSSYCQNFKGQTDSLYLYENAEGRRIPNLPLLVTYNSLANCASMLKYPSMTEDPFLHPEKFLQPKHKKKWNEQKTRIQNIYGETKKRLISVLQKRKDGKNDKEIEAAILRVNTVKLKMPDAKLFEDLVASGCEYPNAFYFPDEHAFTICPQLGNFPDSALMSTMSHELAHAIDPCHCAQDLVKTKKGYVTDYAFDVEKSIPQSPVVGEKMAAGVAFEKHPLSSVLKCLQGSSSIGVQVRSAKDIQESYQRGTQSLQAVSEAQKQFGKDIPKNYSRYGACAFFSGNSQLSESFADWASAQVLADKIKEIPESEKARQFAFESQSVFLSGSCPGSLALIQEKASDALGTSGPSCGEAFKDLETIRNLSKIHPVSPDRMTKIIYAQPEVQKALGCKPTQAKACQ